MRITTQSLPDGDLQLALDGELDIATVDLLRTAVARSLADTTSLRLVLDLGAVSFCDSTGVRALVSSHDQARDAGVQMRITNAQDIVERVLRVTGVWTTLTSA
jgi:anti-sigma B factor antagonist